MTIETIVVRHYVVFPVFVAHFFGIATMIRVS